MSYRWHAFYLSLILALLAALLMQGAKVQRAALAEQRAVGAAELYRMIRATPARYQILDLREGAEFEDGHLPQALNVKSQVLGTASLDRFKPTVVVTEDGDARLFAEAASGIKLAANLEGGMLQWRMSRLPEVSGLTDIEGLKRGRPG